MSYEPPPYKTDQERRHEQLERLHPEVFETHVHIVMYYLDLLAFKYERMYEKGAINPWPSIHRNGGYNPLEYHSLKDPPIDLDDRLLAVTQKVMDVPLILLEQVRFEINQDYLDNNNYPGNATLAILLMHELDKAIKIVGKN